MKIISSQKFQFVSCQYKIKHGRLRVFCTLLGTDLQSALKMLKDEIEFKLLLPNFVLGA